MTKKQRWSVIHTLHGSIDSTFDRIDQLEKEFKNGFEHTIAREALYSLLRIKDKLKECKPFRSADFDQLEKMVGYRVRPDGRLKYGWFGYI